MPASVRPLIIHASHHKAGSTVMRKILHDVCKAFNLVFVCGTQEEFERVAHVDVWLHPSAQIDFDRLQTRAVIGTHSLRDPRSIIVSGYDFHRHVQTESWLRDTGYQQALCARNHDDGIEYEMRHVGGTTIRAMLEWKRQHKSDVRFTDVHYENLVLHFDDTMRRVFTHYGIFSPTEIRRCIHLARRHAPCNRLTKTLVHVTNKQQDLTCWRTRLSQQHLTLFATMFPTALVQLGYNNDDDDDDDAAA